MIHAFFLEDYNWVTFINFLSLQILLWSFPGDSDGKESACNARDLGLIPMWDPLEKGMATHSSVLAWRIPWVEEPGGATVSMTYGQRFSAEDPFNFLSQYRKPKPKLNFMA